LDYEGEIVLVIAKGGRYIAEDCALAHIFGLTLCNEGTVRDWLRHGKYNNTPGKNFDKSGSMGPWIVTSDEIDLRRPLELTTRVNSEVRQRDSTARMTFSFQSLVAYLTTFATLMPGDLIVTGTPTGAGSRFDPPRWLVPGDVVEVEVPGIGVLRNSVVDEPQAQELAAFKSTHDHN
jgi:2-keto-4-pentenoate hydratase/2-oxohepta-3-ene-1,7-dioic acid hydratase in catechol pathway